MWNSTLVQFCNRT